MSQTKQAQAAPARQFQSDAPSPPAVQPDAGDFAASASTKVQLDIDDAPFLQAEKASEPPAVKPEAPSPAVPDAEETKAPPKSKKKLVILVALLLLLGGGGGGAWFFLFRNTAPPPPPPPAAPIIVVPRTPPPPPEYSLTLDPFWVELQNPKDERVFLVVSFSLTTKDEALYQEMQAKTVILRDAVYYYLRNKAYAFLADQSRMELIRAYVLSTVNNYLVQGELTDMLFDSYLMK